MFMPCGKVRLLRTVAYLQMGSRGSWFYLTFITTVSSLLYLASSSAIWVYVPSPFVATILPDGASLSLPPFCNGSNLAVPTPLSRPLPLLLDIPESSPEQLLVLEQSLFSCDDIEFEAAEATDEIDVSA